MDRFYLIRAGFFPIRDRLKAFQLDTPAGTSRITSLL